MKNTRWIGRSRRRLSDAAPAVADEGLTIIEVLVAVIIVVIVALSSAGVTINGLNTSAAQERNQVAVTIANGQMEKISGWSSATNSATGVSNLYTGRCQSTVSTAFTTTYPSVPGVSTTYPAWDPAATLAGTCNAATFPVSTTTTQNGTSYTVVVLLGTCYEPAAGGSCTKLTGQSTPPTSDPSGYTSLIRAIVYVTWNAGATCSTNGCSYEATSFIDTHADPEWVTH